jgi:hypothetical protein
MPSCVYSGHTPENALDSSIPPAINEMAVMNDILPLMTRNKRIIAPMPTRMSLSMVPTFCSKDSINYLPGDLRVYSLLKTCFCQQTGIESAR